MMNLFQKVNFISHSGKPLDWKLECDALTNEDWECIAYLISKKFTFYGVSGVKQGGLKLAKALEKYCDNNLMEGLFLIVDDVLTTGGSMEEMKKYYRICTSASIQGVVLFARGECPDWITPIFQMMEDC